MLVYDVRVCAYVSVFMWVGWTSKNFKVTNRSERCQYRERVASRIWYKGFPKNCFAGVTDWGENLKKKKVFIK